MCSVPSIGLGILSGSVKLSVETCMLWKHTFPRWNFTSRIIYICADLGNFLTYVYFVFLICKIGIIDKYYLCYLVLENNM